MGWKQVLDRAASLVSVRVDFSFLMRLKSNGYLISLIVVVFAPHSCHSLCWKRYSACWTCSPHECRCLKNSVLFFNSWRSSKEKRQPLREKIVVVWGRWCPVTFIQCCEYFWPSLLPLRWGHQEQTLQALQRLQHKTSNLAFIYTHFRSFLS